MDDKEFINLVKKAIPNIMYEILFEDNEDARIKGIEMMRKVCRNDSLYNEAYTTIEAAKELLRQGKIQNNKGRLEERIKSIEFVFEMERLGINLNDI